MNKYLSLCIGTLFGFHFMLAADLQPEHNSKGKWGFVDSTGTPVVDYKYDAVVPFDGNYAKICKNQKWGYVNRSGTEVLSQHLLRYSKNYARFREARETKKELPTGWKNSPMSVHLSFTVTANKMY